MDVRARNRALSIGFVVASVGAVGWLVAGPLRGNVVYYRTPTEAVEQREQGDTSRFRLAGEVVEGSVVEGETTTEFDVTDGEATVHVVHDGEPPQMFGDGAPVVAEGKWRADDAFGSDRIMIRHGNEYHPPEVAQEGGKGGGG